MTQYEFRIINGRNFGRQAVGPWYQYIENTLREEVVDVHGQTPVKACRNVIAWTHDESTYPDRMRQHIQSRRFGCIPLVEPPEPIEADLARFASAYPALADLVREKFQVVPPTPQAAGLFPLGRFYRAQANLPDHMSLTRAQTDEIIRRHASGDLGHANVADVKLDDDKRWLPHLSGIAVQAAVAIQRGAGFVNSVYNVDIPSLKGITVSVATLLDSTREPQTALWYGSPGTLS